MKKEDIEKLDQTLQEYIRNTFHYICHLKDMKSKAEDLRTHIHDFKVLQNEEMIKSIEEEYNALTRLICKGYKE